MSSFMNGSWLNWSVWPNTGARTAWPPSPTILTYFRQLRTGCLIKTYSYITRHHILPTLVSYNYMTAIKIYEQSNVVVLLGTTLLHRGHDAYFSVGRPSSHWCQYGQTNPFKERIFTSATGMGNRRSRLRQTTWYAQKMDQKHAPKAKSARVENTTQCFEAMGNYWPA